MFFSSFYSRKTRRLKAVSSYSRKTRRLGEHVVRKQGPGTGKRELRRNGAEPGARYRHGDEEASGGGDGDGNGDWSGTGSERISGDGKGNESGDENEDQE